MTPERTLNIMSNTVGAITLLLLVANIINIFVKVML